jgi:hypothetical protein
VWGWDSVGNLSDTHTCARFDSSYEQEEQGFVDVACVVGGKVILLQSADLEAATETLELTQRVQQARLLCHGRACVVLAENGSVWAYSVCPRDVSGILLRTVGSDVEHIETECVLTSADDFTQSVCVTRGSWDADPGMNVEAEVETWLVHHGTLNGQATNRLSGTVHAQHVYTYHLCVHKKLLGVWPCSNTGAEILLVCEGREATEIQVQRRTTRLPPAIHTLQLAPEYGAPAKADIASAGQRVLIVTDRGCVALLDAIRGEWGAVCSPASCLSGVECPVLRACCIVQRDDQTRVLLLFVSACGSVLASLLLPE